VPAERTLLLRRSDVESLLTVGECIDALEQALDATRAEIGKVA